MNVVVFAAYATNSPHFETELDIAHGHLDAGDNVTILTCGGELPACEPNPFHDAPRCAKCMARRDAGLALLPPGVTVEPFYRLTDEDRRELDQLPTQFESQEQLQDLRVGRFDIGYAVLSSVISKVRDTKADPTAHGELLRGFLRAAWIVHRSMLHYLDTHEVDRVYVFNGRFAPMRAVLRACRERGVDCFVHERGRDPTRYMMFRNTTIHDVKTVQDLIRDAWKAAPEPDREKVARQWYETRARGQDQGSHVSGQRARRLPADWDGTRRNIAVFLSSEYELASIGDAWRNPLYESQTAALRAIIESLRSDPGDIHLNIRVHPFLSLDDNDQTRQVQQLEAPFITIIPPADPVDTYELMRNSTTVLTFGSTTGIEAVYWGKPSILVGVTSYGDLGVTYKPETHEELIELLRSDLEPHPVESTLAYGYFWPTFGIPHKYFTPEGPFKGRFKGERIRPSAAAQARITALALLHPQRVFRHLKRIVTKRWGILRNKLRHGV